MTRTNDFPFTDVQCDVRRDDSICQGLLIAGAPAWTLYLRLESKHSSGQYRYYLREGNSHYQFDSLPPSDEIQGSLTVICRTFEERSLNRPSAERSLMMLDMIQEILSLESHYEGYLAKTILREIDRAKKDATGPRKIGMVVNITVVEFHRHYGYYPAVQPEEEIAAPTIISRFDCEVHHDHNIFSEGLTARSPGTAYVRLRYKVDSRRYSYYLDAGSDEPLYDPFAPFDEIQVPVTERELEVDQTMSQAALSVKIQRILSVQPDVADFITVNISSTLAQAAGESADPTKLVLALVLNITSADFELSFAKFVPASETAIKVSQKLKYEGSTDEDCAVCMEKLQKGVEVIVTPCMHVYHSDCICTWLSTSHVCPLCRYKFPVD